MKRFLTLFLAFALVFCMGCDTTPAGKYQKAVKKYGSEDGVVCDFINNINLSSDTQNTNSTYSGKYYINNNKNSFKIEGAVSVDSDMGSPIGATIEAYYVGGKLYSNVAGSKLYMSMKKDNVISQIGLCGLATGLSEEDFEGIVLSSTEQGDTITFVVPKKSFNKFNGVASFLSRISKNGDEVGELTIEAIKGQILLDSSNRPIAQNITISAVISYADGFVTLNDEIKTTFTYEEVPEISVPDKDFYKEIEK